MPAGGPNPQRIAEPGAGLTATKLQARRASLPSLVIMKQTPAIGRCHRRGYAFPPCRRTIPLTASTRGRFIAAIAFALFLLGNRRPRLGRASF
jgi:hypothetical protein